MESRPQAAAQVQNTRRTLGGDARYQPVSDRSTPADTTVTAHLLSDRTCCPISSSPSHRWIRAAVHADVRAVNEPGTRAGEERDEVRQLLHPCHPAQRVGSHFGGEAALPFRHVAAPLARLG